MSDEQILTCQDCSAEFPFTAEEQEFYSEKGFSAPKRCRDCRQKKKDGRRTVTDVTCAGCGQQTTVPFVPSSDKPVYCRDCFDKQRSGGDTAPTGDAPTGDAPTGDAPTGDAPTGDTPTGDTPAET